MSNRFFGAASASIMCIALGGCMQDLTQKSYSSTEQGYEQLVAENIAKHSQQQDSGSGSSGYVKTADVPVIINNPYAVGQALGAPAASAYAPAGAYGGLNGGVIQSGVFMQNNAPLYQPPTSFGGTYSPSSGGR